MIYQPPFHGETKYLVMTKYNDAFPYHWHKEIELLWCVSGGLCMYVEGRRLEIGVGDAIFINSAEEHSFRPTCSDTEVLVIEVGDRLLGDGFDLFASHQYENNFIDLTKDNALWKQTVKAALETIYNESKHTSDSDSLWMLQAKLFEVFALLWRNLPFRGQSYNDDQQKKHLVYMKNIQPALDYIEQNFDKQITVGGAAAEANYERTSFCRVFRLATGVTFLQYLNSRRIDEAKMLLSGNDMSIQEIGARCGMPHAKTFSRVFRQYCGMTPSEYRKVHRQ